MSGSFLRGIETKVEAENKRMFDTLIASLDEAVGYIDEKSTGITSRSDVFERGTMRIAGIKATKEYPTSTFFSPSIGKKGKMILNIRGMSKDDVESYVAFINFLSSDTVKSLHEADEGFDYSLELDMHNVAQTIIPMLDRYLDTVLSPRDPNLIRFFQTQSGHAPDFVNREEARVAAEDRKSFFEAIAKQDIEFLEKSYKGNINLYNSDGLTALMVAAKLRKPMALEWCIENGVGRSSVDKTYRAIDMTALMYACSSDNSNPMYTTDYDDPACAILLLRCGADFRKTNKDKKTAADLAKECGLTKIGELLDREDLEGYISTLDKISFDSRKRNKDRETPMKLKKPSGEIIDVDIGDYLASRSLRGDVDTLRRFRKYNHFVDLDGRNILMYACLTGNKKVLEYIFFENDPESKNKREREFLKPTDDFGCTFLHFVMASSAGYSAKELTKAKVLELIIDNLGDSIVSYINTPDGAGFTPLHMAIQSGGIEEVKMLLKHGAIITPLGETPAIDLTANEELKGIIAEAIAASGGASSVAGAGASAGGGVGAAADGGASASAAGGTDFRHVSPLVAATTEEPSPHVEADTSKPLEGPQQGASTRASTRALG